MNKRDEMLLHDCKFYGSSHIIFKHLNYKVPWRLRVSLTVFLACGRFSRIRYQIMYQCGKSHNLGFIWLANNSSVFKLVLSCTKCSFWLCN